jgi:hypothetical protein
MPDQACHGTDTDKEHHSSRGEQEAHEPHKQAHSVFFRSNLAPTNGRVPKSHFNDRAA